MKSPTFRIGDVVLYKAKGAKGAKGLSLPAVCYGIRKGKNIWRYDVYLETTLVADAMQLEHINKSHRVRNRSNVQQPFNLSERVNYVNWSAYFDCDAKKYFVNDTHIVELPGKERSQYKIWVSCLLKGVGESKLTTRSPTESSSTNSIFPPSRLLGLPNETGPSSKPRGFVNVGNTCYVAAALQVWKFHLYATLSIIK
jgi:hypothetical protein